MREFERKKKIKKALYSRPVIFLLFIVLAFLIHATWNIYKKQQISKIDLQEVKKESDGLALREAHLKDAVAYLNTDEGIEAEIRSKFRAVRPGEQVAVIIHNDVEKVLLPPEKKSFWMKIKSFFGII